MPESTGIQSRNAQPSKVKPIIGITLGDPCGIGPEVTQKALQSPEILGLNADIRLFGDSNLETFTPGAPSKQSGEHALKALNEAKSAILNKEIDGIVTAPISKEWATQAGFKHPGQTEFFAELENTENYAMCLTGPSLTVVLATIHVPIHQVPQLLSTEEIIRIGKLTAAYSAKVKNLPKPRIAICGLNPHAGENGNIGCEDMTLIAPAIKQLQKEYPQAEFTGPHVPDVVFRQAVLGDYDAVVAMYHDQGLIPLKLLDFDCGVNVTLGLNCPRTSPDHGTAFDIAGKGQASEKSMIEAIKLALKLT